MYISGQFKDTYDIIVVGAGPSGSMAAWQAAKKGSEVLLLEKDREVGIPVRCAEAVGQRDLEKLIEHPAPSHWVAAEIQNFRLFAPNGTPVYVNIDEKGFVLHRRLFDYDLAIKAVNAGAKLLTHSEVVDVIKAEKRVTGVRVKVGEKFKEIKAKIVIAADGVESRVARWAGINSLIKPGDMETCVQYTLAGLDIDTDTCNFYFSQDFAPGGYAWVFPKGEGLANIGLGISGDFARKMEPEKYLNIFLERFFPGKSVVSKTVGGVPADKTLKEIVANGFMVIGDAAHQANPVSGGGIISGMIAGEIAGKVAVNAIRSADVSKKSLLPYAREWQRRVGKSHQRFYRLKGLLIKFQDEQLNNIMSDYLQLESSKQNLMNLYKITFKNHPALLLDVIKIFSKI